MRTIVEQWQVAQLGYREALRTLRQEARAPLPHWYVGEVLHPEHVNLANEELMRLIQRWIACSD